jgi:hypothetical protein
MPERIVDALGQVDLDHQHADVPFAAPEMIHVVGCNHKESTSV